MIKRHLAYLLIALPVSILQAQPTVAPTPVRTGPETGSDWGTYNVADSAETGFRFSFVGGDRSLYRNSVNFGNGFRVLGSNFAASSKDGHGTLFDSLLISTQGLGNDPYQNATMRVEKNGAYRYEMLWRQSDYDNQPLDNGASATQMTTRRMWQTHDLGITLKKWLGVQLGYTGNDENGPAISNYEMYIGGLARTVLPLDKAIAREYNEYRLGTRLDIGSFRLMLSHQWAYFKDDTPYISLAPGQPYPLPLAQLYQPALPVTYPLLGTAYSRSAPMHVATPGWFGDLSRSSKLWAVNARISYIKGDSKSVYSESESGARAVANSACSNCGAGAPATSATYMPGAAQRPFSSGDVTFTLFPSGRLTLVNSASGENNRYDGAGQMLQVNTAVATKNIHWDYRLGTKRFSDSLDLNYRFTDRLGLNAEYRYSDRRITNNLVRTGTTNNKDLNNLRDHLNTGTFGFRFRATQSLSLNADATVGLDNAPENPTSPASYFNIRARADYRYKKRVRIATTYRQVYNVNEAPASYHNPQTQCCAPPLPYFTSHSRDLSATSSFTVNRDLSLDVSYTNLHLDTFANLWTEQPAAGSVTIVSVPGNTSRYISNLHVFSFMATTTIAKRTSLYVGYNISRDTGDGRSVQNLGLTNPAASFLAMASTFPMTYQAPLARLSIPLSPKIRWNAGWEFYRYSQKFAYFGYQPYYRANTGYTSLTLTM
jgi:hypothetical protein